MGGIANRRISRAPAELIVLVGGASVGPLAPPAAMAAANHVARDLARLKGKASRISSSGAKAVGSHAVHDHPGAGIR